MPKEFENGSFTLKALTHQMFFVHRGQKTFWLENGNVFCPHYAREIWKRNNHKRQERLSAPVSMRIARF